MSGMPEHIEREALLQALEEVGGCDAPPDSWANGWDKGISEAIKFVKELPAADVAEVRHGKWNKNGNGRDCSICGFKYYANGGLFNFCPNCGARMDGDDSG